MPNAATVQSTSQTGTKGGSAGSTANGRTQSAGVVPFPRASQLYREGPFYDKSFQLGASAQNSGSIELPAYGYARAIVLVVKATGGVSTPAVVFAEDGPFSVLSNIFYGEPNGAIIDEFSRGFHLYLANKWGGYQWSADPKQDPDYLADTATGNFTFIVRIPLEINLRDGLGALPNQNAAAAFKLRFQIADSGTVYTTPPGTTLPSVNVKAYLEAWDQPEVSTGGQSNQTTPPAMNTTQFWSELEIDSAGGIQKLRLTRMGNYLRNLIFVVRRGNTSRANGDTDWPDPLTLYRDTAPIDQIARVLWRKDMKERSGYVNTIETPGGLDKGVFVYDFMHEFDGHYGKEIRDQWMPTISSTRLEIQGQFAAQADHLTVLVNDVSTAGNVFM